MLSEKVKSLYKKSMSNQVKKDAREELQIDLY